MKKILLSALVSCFTFGIYAQTYYSEDFESSVQPALPANATSIDQDGDSYGWETTNGWAAYPPFAAEGIIVSSRSWTGTAGALNPDNYMVLGPIDLSSASGVVTLAWETGTIEGAPYHAEQYSVYVTTANDVPSILASTAVHNETFAAGAVMYSRQVNVSSFIGSTVYVTFRHHDTFDMNMIGVANVSVATVLADDAGISDITTSEINLLSGGAINCSGVVTNYGSSAINSVDVNWSIDGGTTMTENLTGLNITAGGTHSFTHANQWTPSGIGCSDLQIWTSNVNGNTDPNSTNDSKTIKVSVVDQSIAKLPIYENFTSNTCGPCASFNPGFQALIDANNVNDGLNAGVANVKYQMNWPGAADQSYNADGNTRRTYYGVSGIPDHYIDGDDGNASQSEINAHKAGLSGLDLSTIATWTGNNLTVDVTVNPIACYGSTDLKLFIAVTEDSYTNTAGSNGESTFYQVMRKMLPDGNGTSLGALTAGTSVNVSESYSFTVGGVAANNYNLWVGPTNTTVVVFVQDIGTGEIINSGIAVNGCGSSGPSTTASGTDPSGCGLTDGTAAANVTGGTTPYTYSWSNGGTSANITGLSGGTYTVIVTDAGGCTTTGSTVLTTPPAPTTTASGTDPTTCGTTDGTAVATASGGTLPYTYSWSNGASTASITGLSAGTYTVTITDAGGCTSTTSVTINPVTPPTLVATGTDPTGCGSNDGTAAANATGGTSPYVYNWSNGGTTSGLTGLAGGTYIVTVTDANNCTAVATVVLNDIGAPVVTLTQTDLACYGDANGTITSAVSGGQSPYTYAWSNAGTTSSVSGLSSGTYTVTVTDAGGCSGSQTTTITEPIELTATATVTHANCPGDATGTINLTAVGGTAPLAYSWSMGSSSEDLSGLASGTYSVTVTDNNGCTVASSFTVTELSTGPQTGIVSGSIQVAESSVEQYTVTQTAGSTYAWSATGGNVGTGQGTNTVDIQWGTAGTGQVSVVESDSIGCLGTAATLDVTIGTSTGVSSNFVQNITIYPNPANDFLHIEIKETLNVKEARIFDAKGKSVYVQKGHTKINVSELPTGIYLIQLTTEDGKQIKRKWMKE